MKAPYHRTPRYSMLARAAAFALIAASPVCALAQAAAPVESDDAPRAKEDSTRLGTIVIQGSGDRLGAGQILREDAVKARSTVTRASTEKDRATGNPFQALSLLPGVNTFSYDATGLFGGGMTVRGFGSDQMGFTINGVPVNDSGSYSIFPQEYADQENLCTQSISQGNPDVESPHIGATGGNVTITNCDPEDKRRLRFAQTFGSLNMHRTFLRGDTGRFFDDKAKLFLSYSHTESDKFKGLGKAKKDHIDAALSYDFNADNKVLASVLYNRAINNNYLTVSQAQIAANGYGWDYNQKFVGHLTPVNGTIQNEAAQTPQFYKLSLNPFENAIVSASGSFKLAADTYLKVQPYLWYGYGTGGNQQATLSESRFLLGTGALTGRADINGDGDTLDTIIVARSSVTKTSRPGVTTEVNTSFGAHQVKVGFWYEKANHRQTQPAVLVDAAGNPTDQWLENGRVHRADGSEYQGRDWKSVTPATQLYVSDQWGFAGDDGVLSFGLRAPHTTRNFTNYANEGNGASAAAQTTYTYKQSYSAVLPQFGVRYKLSREHQIFANIGKNFRAPPNFAFAPSSGNVSIVGGLPVLGSPIKAETSIVTDLGYRYQSKALTLSVTVYNVDYRDRQANAYDPILDKTVYTNAGKVNNRGMELEAGTAPIKGFTFYGSLTLQKSKVLNDISPAKGITLPTNGKQYALTPETLIGASVQYTAGPLYIRSKMKFTGGQFATLMNDEVVARYKVLDLDGGYKVGDFAFLKSVQFRANLSNVLNQKYLNPSSGTTLNSKPVVTSGGTQSAATVFYYVGAPRFASVSLSADF
jgi:iron complex outermembrane recepter protein